MLSAGIFMHFLPCLIESDILKQFMKFNCVRAILIAIVIVVAVVELLAL